MSELIRKQDAIDAIQKLNIPEDMCVFEIISHIEVEIATLPSVQPNHNAEVSKMEIIRCKDCKYWKEKPLYTYCEKMYRMGILDVLDYATEENDFCSMAEKRGEADGQE